MRWSGTARAGGAQRAYHGLAVGLIVAHSVAGCSAPRAPRAVPSRDVEALASSADEGFVAPLRVSRAAAGSGTLVDPQAALAVDGRWTTMTAPAGARDGEAPTLVLDFGREVARQPELFVAPGSVGRVEVTLGESFAELDAHPRDVPFPVRFGIDASGSTGRWTGPVSGFRYLAVTVRPAGSAAASVRLDAARAVGGSRAALARPAGRFESSDSGLDRAWAAGVESARLCLSPGADAVLLDGAKRDRAVWAADLAIAARTLYVSGVEPSAVTRSLVRLAGLRPSTDTSLQPVAATDHDGGKLELVEYGAWWLVAARDAWRETGDDVTVRRLFPKVSAEAEWLARRVEADGLIHKRAAELEWCYSLHRVGALTSVNVVSSEGLEAASDLARVVGEPDAAARWDRAAVTLRGAVLAKLWDARAGTFATSLDDRERLSLDANALPIWFDWLPADDAERVLEAIRTRLWGPWGPRNVDRSYPQPDGPEHDGRVWPFLAYLELDARLRPGRDPGLGFELVRRTWGHMLAHEPGNTFWEWIGSTGDPESPRTSLAHAWSGAVTAALTERVLGVRCVAPRNFEIAPVVGALTHARGTRPTAWGPIHLSFSREPAARRFTLEVSMPPGTRVTRFVLPAPEHAVITLGGQPLAIATDTSRVADVPVIAERRSSTVVVQAPPSLEYRFTVVERAADEPDELESAGVGLEDHTTAPVG